MAYAIAAAALGSSRMNNWRSLAWSIAMWFFVAIMGVNAVRFALKGAWFISALAALLFVVMALAAIMISIIEIRGGKR
jgi:hypothetical protein